MNPLAWLLAPVLAFLLGVPLGSALIIATVATPPAGSPNANPCAPPRAARRGNEAGAVAEADHVAAIRALGQLRAAQEQDLRRPPRFVELDLRFPFLAAVLGKGVADGVSKNRFTRPGIDRFGEQSGEVVLV